MFKLMTLNLNYYVEKHGPWEQRLKQIRRAVEDHEPHIITLQAVKRDPNLAMGVDQARQLAGLIPGAEEVIFQPAQSFPDGSEHGSAILARIPCTESMAVPLSLRPGLDDTNERVLLYARFDLPDGPLHVFDAHFSW